MKLTKLSLMATLAISASFGAEVSGKLTGYTLNPEAGNTQKDAALTVSIKEKLTNNISINATMVAIDALGASTPLNDGTAQTNGTFTSEANIVATFGNTTVKAGRQYIESPMFYSFDWLMKPVAYEAVAIINTDIANTTLVAVDASKMAGNTAMSFEDLTGTNRAYGAVYSTEDYNAQAWFYDIENGSYEQTYLDATKSFGNIELSAQYVNTDFETTTDSKAYGIKASTQVSGVDVTVAAVDTNDAAGTYVGGDSMYTSMWNTFAIAETVGTSTMISASKEINGVDLSVAHAEYEGNDNFETNVIAGYSVNDKIDLTAVYSDTDNSDALEFIANYNF